jgi:hypothetical protein
MQGASEMNGTALPVARPCVPRIKHGAASEALLDEDDRFTRPIDNALHRATSLTVCWPNGA